MPTLTSKSRRWQRLSRTAKIVYSLIFTVMAGITGILGYFGIQPGHAPPPAPQLVSSDGSGSPANQDSGRPSIDRSGRYIAFTSAATNLSPSVSSPEYNIYRKDLKSGDIDLVSTALDGSTPNGSSQFPAICSTGRFVAFASTATNLVPETTRPSEGEFQVYIKDVLSGQVTLISVGIDGEPGRGDSRAPNFNGDCTKVVFESSADDLVIGDQNRVSDVFVRDIVSRKTTVVSVDDAGGWLDDHSTHAAIDSAGAMVAFTSWATNIDGAIEGQPGVYVHEMRTAQNVAVSSQYTDLGPDVEGFSWPDFSADGRYLIIRSTTDAQDPSHRGRHVLVWDMKSQKSAITKADGSTPTGWSDACTSGVNNGTDFSPMIAQATKTHSYRILFTVSRAGVCNLVIRDLEGRDLPIKPQVNVQQVLEPTLNSTGDYLSWAVAGQPQLIYACRVTDCTEV